MLKRRNTLEQAQGILSLLDKDIRLEHYFNSEDVVVGTFKNGREQGYQLTVFPPHDLVNSFNIMFAEQRSSDDIVVYWYIGSSNSISDEVYENARYFRYSDRKGTIDYIIDLILEQFNMS